ncbi:hypothetical protein ACTXT7_016580 [Hymenolepis weldensis]
MEQMDLSKPDKDPEDYLKNVGEFHYEPSVGEIFTTWYARNRDIYENRMAGLPNETRINMLLRKFSKSDRDLYLATLSSHACVRTNNNCPTQFVLLTTHTLDLDAEILLNQCHSANVTLSEWELKPKRSSRIMQVAATFCQTGSTPQLANQEYLLGREIDSVKRSSGGITSFSIVY